MRSGSRAKTISMTTSAIGYTANTAVITNVVDAKWTRYSS